MSAEDLPANPLAGTAGARRPLGAENAAWVEGRDVDLDHLVTVERLRHQYPDLVQAAHDAVGEQGVKAKLLRFLAFDGETASFDYDTLAGVVNVERRTVRYHVADLDDAGLVERASVGPATAVEWHSDAAYLLTSEVLSVHER